MCVYFGKATALVMERAILRCAVIIMIIVSGDKKIEKAIIVNISPACSNHMIVAGNAHFGTGFSKAAFAITFIQFVYAIGGNKQIIMAVIIVIVHLTYPIAPVLSFAPL
jgi:hypothetical protein